MGDEKEERAKLSEAAGPVSGSRMPDAFVRAVGRFAYVWGWPMVSMINRRTGLTSVPEPGLRGGALPNAPMGRVCMMTDYIPPTQRFVACTNQDVLYGFGFGTLDEQPAVLQIPDFGDRFWVAAAWDHRTDSFAQLGKQYGTQPGFYAVVGPNWDGTLPRGDHRQLPILDGIGRVLPTRVHQGHTRGSRRRP